jgi:hypothetical protein
MPAGLTMPGEPPFLRVFWRCSPRYAYTRAAHIHAGRDMVSDMLADSTMTMWFYEHNFLLNIIICTI